MPGKVLRLSAVCHLTVRQRRKEEKDKMPGKVLCLSAVCHSTVRQRRKEEKDAG